MPSQINLGGIFSVLRHRLKISEHFPSVVTDWDRSLWPINYDAHFANAVEKLVSHEGNESLGRAQVPYLESLYDPDVPVSTVALLMICLASTSKQKDEHAAAIEALVATIEDGRLDGAQLGQTLRDLFRGHGLRKTSYWRNSPYAPLVSVTRWAKALKPASQASLYHAYVVAYALQQFFQGDATAAPRDVGQLLELFMECLLETKDMVSSEGSRQYLKDVLILQPKSKAGKLCKQLLELKRSEEHDQKRDEMCKYVYERRLGRARRWQSGLDQVKCNDPSHSP